VKALHDSYTEINRTTTAKKPKGRIFISKAVILLSLAKKSRDPAHFFPIFPTYYYLLRDGPSKQNFCFY